MTAPASLWAITDVSHPALRGVSDDCDECLALANDAISHAKATGSTGSSYSIKGGHSVTVTRAIAAVARPGGLNSPDVTVDADSLIRTVAKPLEGAQ